MGRSGTGKGTQLELLGKYLSDKSGLPDTSLDMGNIFRTFFKEESYLRTLGKEMMNDGKFLPDFYTDSLFVKNAIEVINENSVLFIDGYPRRMGQFETLKQVLNFANRTNPVIFNINVSRESVKKRMLLRARADDYEEAIDKRLKEYEDNVVPVIEAIKTDSFFTYFEINGEPSIEEIHKDIISKLNL